MQIKRIDVLMLSILQRFHFFPVNALPDPTRCHSAMG